MVLVRLQRLILILQLAGQNYKSMLVDLKHLNIDKLIWVMGNDMILLHKMLKTKVISVTTMKRWVHLRKIYCNLSVKLLRKVDHLGYLKSKMINI